jgi:hypothetical protein
MDEELRRKKQSEIWNYTGETFLENGIVDVEEVFRCLITLTAELTALMTGKGNEEEALNLTIKRLTLVHNLFVENKEKINEKT